MEAMKERLTQPDLENREHQNQQILLMNLEILYLKSSIVYTSVKIGGIQISCMVFHTPPCRDLQTKANMIY